MDTTALNAGLQENKIEIGRIMRFMSESMGFCLDPLVS